MCRLDLTDEEHEELLRVLRFCANGLAVEIIHTDHAEFRKMLRQREQLVQQILAKAEAREVAAVA